MAKRDEDLSDFEALAVELATVGVTSLIQNRMKRLTGERDEALRENEMLRAENERLRTRVEVLEGRGRAA